MIKKQLARLLASQLQLCDIVSRWQLASQLDAFLVQLEVTFSQMKQYLAFSFSWMATQFIMVSSSQLKTSQLASQLSDLVASQYKLYYSRKNPNRRGLRTYVFVKSPGICRSVTLPLEIPYKAKLHPWNSTKSNCVSYSYHLEIFHMIFFLIIPGNSTPFLIDPWNFHILFFLSSTPFPPFPHPLPPPVPPCLDLFWNTPVQLSVEATQQVQLATDLRVVLQLANWFTRYQPETIAHKVI